MLDNRDSLPEFNQVVTASRDETFDIVWFLSRWLIDQTAWDYSRSPTDCITANLQQKYTLDLH